MRNLVLFTVVMLPVMVFAQESTTTIVELNALEKADSALMDLLVKIQEIVDPLVVGGVGTVLGLVIAGKRAKKILKIAKPLAHILISAAKILDFLGQSILKMVAKIDE